MSSPSSEHLAVVHGLQQAGAAQQRGLARAGAADQRHDLVLADREVDRRAGRRCRRRPSPRRASRAPARLPRSRSQQAARLLAAPGAGGHRVGQPRGRAPRAARTAGPATTYGVKLKLCPTRICAARTASTAPSTEISPTSFCSATKSLSSGGGDRAQRPAGGRRSAWSAGGSARASGRPRAGSGAPTRCRRGRPRRRTRCRPARSPPSPGRAATWAPPAGASAGHPEADEVQHDDQRHAAEEVDVDRRHDPQRGEGRAAQRAGERDQQTDDQHERRRRSAAPGG